MGEFNLDAISTNTLAFRLTEVCTRCGFAENDEYVCACLDETGGRTVTLEWLEVKPLSEHPGPSLCPEHDARAEHRKVQ